MVMYSPIETDIRVVFGPSVTAHFIGQIQPSIEAKYKATWRTSQQHTIMTLWIPLLQPILILMYSPP
jgi:hypothetical protein